MKVLILHHCEPIWDAGLKKIAGISFEEFEEQIYNYLQDNNFDKIILTRFEEFRILPGEYCYLANYINQLEVYDYGWTKELCEQNNLEYTEGGAHSEVVWITDWQKQLKGHEVYIAGAFDGECIEDLEIALRHCEVDYKRINELIY